MGKWDTYPFGLDLSHYDEIVNADMLKGNVDFLICKAGGTDSFGPAYVDSKFATHVQLAYNIGVPCGAYWFVNPRIFLEHEISYEDMFTIPNEGHPVLLGILKAMSSGNGGFKKVNFLAFDLEDNSMTTTVGKVGDVWLAGYLNDIRERLVNLMRQGKFPQMPILIYSRRSFIDEVEKNNPEQPISTFLGNHPEIGIWVADWRFNPTAGLLKMDVAKTKRPTENAVPRSFGWSAGRNKTWQFWQWAGDSGNAIRSDAVTTKLGVARSIDCNLWNGTLDELYKWCNFSSGTVVNPPPPPPVDNTNPDVLAIVKENNQLLKEIRSKFS